MKSPLVSVIIPVYNGGQYLRETLESVFSQDYEPFEVIVVDDGSSDDSSDIAQSYSKVRYFHQQNQGPASARNTGITAAQGEYLAFLDADDLWLPEKLRLQIPFQIEQACHGYTLTFQRFLIQEDTPSLAWFKNPAVQKDHLGYFPSTLIAHRTAFDRVGMFDAKFRTGEDLDWFTRAKEAELPMAALEQTLLLKRVHSANITHFQETIRSNTMLVLKAAIKRKRQAPQTNTADNAQ